MSSDSITDSIIDKVAPLAKTVAAFALKRVKTVAKVATGAAVLGAGILGGKAAADDDNPGTQQTGFGGLVGANMAASSPAMGGNVIGQGRFPGAKSADNNGQNSTVNRTALESSSENLNDIERELMEIKEELKEINVKTVPQKVDKTKSTSEESIKAGFNSSKLSGAGKSIAKGGMLGLAGMGALLFALSGKKTGEKDNAKNNPPPSPQEVQAKIDGNAWQKEQRRLKEADPSRSQVNNSSPDSNVFTDALEDPAVEGEIAAVQLHTAKSVTNLTRNVLESGLEKTVDAGKKGAWKSAAALAVTKGVGFAAAKGIPLVGAVVSAGSGFERLLRGDFVGATIDLGAAWASGSVLGTPAAIIAATGNLGRDVYKSIDFNKDGETHFPEDDPEQDKVAERTAYIGKLALEAVMDKLTAIPSINPKGTTHRRGGPPPSVNKRNRRGTAVSFDENQYNQKGGGGFNPSPAPAPETASLTSSTPTNTTIGSILSAATVASATDDVSDSAPGGDSGAPIIVNNNNGGGKQAPVIVPAPTVTVVMGDQMLPGAQGSLRFGNGLVSG